MRAGKLYGLFLLTAVTLGQSCGAGGGGNNRENISLESDSLKAPGGAPGNRGSSGLKDYTDPDRAFSIKIPDGWKVKREENDGSYMTVFSSDEYRAANLSIMTINGAPAKTDSADLQQYRLTEAGKPFFQGWIDGLKEQARVEGMGDVYRTRVDTFDALRLDIIYYRGDKDDPRKGYGLFLIGNKTTFFISLTGNLPGFGELGKIISTLDIEP
jgi:hypothetical protein